MTGISKGKGFAGVDQTLGSTAAVRWRTVRSTIADRFDGGHPQANRVPKGKNMPGRMGSETVTIQNLEVVKVDAERNVILVKGSIPGREERVTSKIRSSVKK